MRAGRALAVLVVAVLAGACATQQVPLPPVAGNLTHVSPSPTGPASSPAIPVVISDAEHAAFLGTSEPLDVPSDPAAAAAYLAGAVRDPATARSSVREILLRSGIGIFRSDTGALAAVPADPSLLDAYVYDFEVPILANALARGSSTSLQPAVDVLAGLGWITPDTTVADLEKLLAAWVQAARSNPTGPVSFAGLVVGELLAAGPESQGEQSPAGIRLDPVGFQVLMASLASGLGHFAGTASGGPAVSLASVRISSDGMRAPADDDVMCDEPAKEYDSGLLDKGIEELLKELAEKVLGEGRVERWGQGLDAGKILNTVMARAALLNGLQITVASGARDTPHYRHSNFSGSGSEVFKLTATAMFKTELGGRLVDCGPLAGLRIPADKGIKGLRLQWSLSDQLECTRGGNNCELLGRINSGGGGGRTDANGESKLEVQTIVEKGCPDDKARCEKGEKTTATAWAKVTPDLTNGPPIDLGDFWMPPAELPVETAKALIKVLVDVVTDMVTAAKPAKGTQTVEYHHLSDYRVTWSAEGITFSGTKCAGHAGPWSIGISGSPGPNTKASGSIDFTLDEDGRGSGTIDMQIVTTVKAGGKTIKASVVVEGTMDVELVTPDAPTSITFSNMRGKATGAASGPNISMSKVFDPEGGGSSSFAVETGAFCKS